MGTAPLAFVGFGEAASAFAQGLDGSATAYDRKTDDAATRAGKRAEAARCGISLAATNQAATASAATILSLVTADQALPAAVETARHIAPATLFCDLNSVAPDTKRAAARAIEAAGGRYVDVAVMAPVHPLRRGVPLLVAGPHAEAGAAALREAGFTQVRIVGANIGDASAIKMIRSVMVKGIEALTAECLLAATRAGVRDAVLASLDASEKPQPWARRGDYNLDRMMLHGLRRADELDEVVKTLEALGTGAGMTRAAVERQRAIGTLHLTPPDGLERKLAALLDSTSTPKEIDQRPPAVAMPTSSNI